MQITSGINRGERLLSPDGLNIRPTSNKVRSAIFNIIRFEIKDCFFLDLFAGTGAIGIQALSEGCTLSCFVEAHYKCVNTIKTNLLKLKLNDKSIIYKKKVENFIVEDEEELNKFDFIFMDPPYIYNYQQYLDIFTKLVSKCKNTAKFIIEHSSDLDFSDIAEKFTLYNFKTKNYGDSNLSIFNR